MTNPDHFRLVWQKLTEFQEKIMKHIKKKEIFKISRRLMDHFLINSDQCFDKAMAMAKLFHFICDLYLDIEVTNKDLVYHEMFNNVIVELLKNLTHKDERLNVLVIPFVNHFMSHGLDHRSIRGLVHKLEESGLMDSKTFYHLG